MTKALAKFSLKTSQLSTSTNELWKLLRTFVRKLKRSLWRIANEVIEKVSNTLKDCGLDKMCQVKTKESKINWIDEIEGIYGDDAMVR